MLCKTCGSAEAFQVSVHLVTCLKCLCENKEVYHKIYNKVRYGLPLSELITMWQRQSLSCVICRKNIELFESCVDHNHETGYVRGLLCRPCNIGLTHGVDLTGLIIYLTDFKLGVRGKIRPHPERGIECLTKRERRKARQLLPEYCEACFSKEPKHYQGRFLVDHCHVTGVIRGHLCFPCNKALGMFRDSVSLLKRASDYISREEIGEYSEPEMKWAVTSIEDASLHKILRSRKKAVLVPDQVRQIRDLLKSKVSKAKIACEFKIHQDTVTQIEKRVTWKHLD